MSSQFDTTRGLFATSAALFNRTVDGIPQEKWVAQPGPDSNHMLWIAGHLVVHRARVLKLLGQEWSAPCESLFVRGAVRSDGCEYPQPSEILAQWTSVCDRVNAALATASPEVLSKAAAPGARSLDGTVGGVISFLSFHEAYHVGQMGFLRKWLGYGQVVG